MTSTPAAGTEATARDRARELRERLRPPGGALAGVPIGTVPILWNNVDIVELRLGTDPETLLDEIARLGYDGCQLGLGFPEGAELRDALAVRDLRLAEVYAALPVSADGPERGALENGLERLRLLVDGGGDVLCVAIDGTPERSAAAGQVGRPASPSAPQLTDDGWRGLASVLHDLARATIGAGARMAFHPHAGTFVETPAEADRLMAETDPVLVPLCLDVGHWLVGGGDPVAALRRYGERVTHLHLKDVNPMVLGRLQAGELDGFAGGIRARLFTELGAGMLDLDGCLAVLAERRYGGWLMVEQDSGWPPPSESAAIGRRVLAAALRRVAGGPGGRR
jgi:inosose dehydratase